jgi:hypothetical protein
MDIRQVASRAGMSRVARVIWWTTIILLATAGSSTRAWAQWRTQIEGSDASGGTKFIAVSADPSGDALALLCDQTSLLALAYLIPATQTELTEMSKPGAELTVTLLLKIGGSVETSFKAQLRRWNNTYLAAVANGRTPELMGIVREIGASSQAISVGMDIFGDKQSESFDSTDSASAMRLGRRIANWIRLEHPRPVMLLRQSAFRLTEIAVASPGAALRAGISPAERYVIHRSGAALSR